MFIRRTTTRALIQKRRDVGEGRATNIYKNSFLSPLLSTCLISFLRLFFSFILRLCWQDIFSLYIMQYPSKTYLSLLKSACLSAIAKFFLFFSYRAPAKRRRVFKTISIYKARIIYTGFCVVYRESRQSRKQPWTSYWNIYTGSFCYVTSYVTFDHLHTHQRGAPH